MYFLSSLPIISKESGLPLCFCLSLAALLSKISKGPEETFCYVGPIAEGRDCFCGNLEFAADFIEEVICDGGGVVLLRGSGHFSYGTLLLRDISPTIVGEMSRWRNVPLEKCPVGKMSHV